MTRQKAGKWMTIVVGLAVGLVAVAAGSFVLRTPSADGGVQPAAAAVSPSPPYTDVHPSPSPVPVSDCATMDFSVLNGRPGDTEPNVGEVNTLYNPETRIDRLTAFDSSKGKDVTFYVSVDDPACWNIPAIAGRIADDIASAAEVLQVECADVLSHLAGAALSAAEIQNGAKEFDPAAAQHFVDESCANLPSPAPTPAA